MVVRPPSYVGGRGGGKKKKIIPLSSAMGHIDSTLLIILHVLSIITIKTFSINPMDFLRGWVDISFALRLEKLSLSSAHRKFGRISENSK